MLWFIYALDNGQIQDTSLFITFNSYHVFVSKQTEIPFGDIQCTMLTVLGGLFSTASSGCYSHVQDGVQGRTSPSLPLWFRHCPLPGCPRLCLRTLLQKLRSPATGAGSAVPEERREDSRSLLGLEEYCKTTICVCSPWGPHLGFCVCVWKKWSNLSAWQHCAFQYGNEEFYVPMLLLFYQFLHKVCCFTSEHHDFYRSMKVKTSPRFLLQLPLSKWMVMKFSGLQIHEKLLQMKKLATKAAGPWSFPFTWLMYLLPWQTVFTMTEKTSSTTTLAFKRPVFTLEYYSIGA